MEGKHEEKEEVTALESMAEDLKRIREAMQRLEECGINKELMTLYIQKKSRVCKRDIDAVLNAQKVFMEEAFTRKTKQ